MHYTVDFTVNTINIHLILECSVPEYNTRPLYMLLGLFKYCQRCCVSTFFGESEQHRSYKTSYFRLFHKLLLEMCLLYFLQASSGQHEEAAGAIASANFMLMNPICNNNIALLSPLISTDESSRDWRSEASLQQARNEAKMRYNEKKKTRT